MDSHAVLQPVGPRPPHVYWVRRLLLLAIVVLAGVLLVHACSGGSTPSGQGPLRQRADQQPLAGQTTTPTASSTPSAGALTDCRPHDLRVAVSSDATTYPRGARPRFTAVVRNAGPACLFPTALSSRTWRILSGVDEVWSTADCSRSPDGKPVTLKAGQQITYVLPWDRFRSTPGCAAEGAPAQAGTYRLYVTIAGANGRPALFHLAD